MAYNLLESFAESQGKAPSLVNQSPGSGGYSLVDSLTAPTPPPPKPPEPPKTWFGEFTNAFGNGVDMLQSMGYGAGALVSSWLGAEGMKDWFLKGYMQNEADIAAHPQTVHSLGDIDSFDKAIRYGLGATGEFAPLVAQNLVTAGIGALAGTAAEPGGGTIAGGITGLVARKSVQRLLASEVKELIGSGIAKELGEYLEGKVAKSALSEMAQKLLTTQGEATAKQLGADAFAAISNVGIMQGALYGDLSKNPEISETDRRAAATLGGFLAALPMTAVAHSITKKFIPGVTEEFLAGQAGKQAVAETNGYMTRFLATGAKEFAKSFAHTGSAMMMQTAINSAAANWADPNTRWNFLEFTPAQWQQMIDSGVRGGVGGGVIGGMIGTISRTAQMSAHPDAKVKSGMRDVLTKADDVKIEPPEVTQDHRDLEAVQDHIGVLEANINSGKLTPEDAAKAQADLKVHQAREQQLIEKLGLNEPPAESLVNQKEPAVEAPKAPAEPPKEPSPLPNTDEAAIERLRAKYAQEMPKQEGTYADKLGIGEKVKDRQAEVDAHIESVAGKGEYAKRLQEAIDPHVVRFMAAENVHLTTDKEGKKAFAADIDNNGKISLYIPTEEQASKMEPEAMAKLFGGDVDAARGDYLANVQRAIHHEIAHAADLVNLREQYDGLVNKNGESLRDYVNRTWTERGARAREADASLPKVGGRAYLFGDKAAELSDLQLGQELPRMAVEMAREGRTTEVTDALDAARRKNGKLDAFFRDWIDTLVNIADKLRKMIDPRTAQPDLLKAYDDINRTLDKYGLLVNQKPESTGQPSDLGPTPEVIKPAPKAAEPPPAPKLAPAPEPAPVKPAATVLPAQQTKIEATTPEAAPKAPNAYQLFRRSIKTDGASDIARNYLNWIQRRDGKLPMTKAEIAAAHLDLIQRAPNTNLTLERFQQIAKDRIREYNENTEVKSQPAQKTSPPEIGQAIGERREIDVSPNAGAARSYDNAISQGLAEAASSAPAGKRLAALRTHLAEHHPEMLPHFEGIVREVEKRGGDEEAAARLKREPRPIRGEETAQQISEYNHAIFIPDEPNEVTRKLAEERGLKVFFAGEEPPADHYIIDPSGDWDGHDLVNENASVQHPVNIENKLQEAQLTKGIPETHALSALGHDRINNDVIADLDARFGVNGWILKNFSPEALRSQGVAFAEAVKNVLAKEPEFFDQYDTSHVMVQKLHNIVESDRTSNRKILSGRELRVHVLTDHDGNAHILPFSTFWKLDVEEAEARKLHDIQPLTVEGPEIRAAHELALEAIRSLPPEERSGQSFGLDVVRLADNEGWGIVENNPTDQNGMSGFFASNPLAHDAYMAALTGTRPVHAELADLAHDAIREDGFLVNQRSEAAQKPSFITLAGGERDLEVTPEVTDYFRERREVIAEMDRARSEMRLMMQQYQTAKNAWHGVEGRVREFGQEFGVPQEVGNAGPLPRMAGDIGILSGVSTEEATHEIRGLRQLKKNFDSAFEIQDEQRRKLMALERRLDEVDHAAMQRFDLSEDDLGYVLESRQYESSKLERSEPAEKPTFSARAEKELKQVMEGTMREFDRVFPDEEGRSTVEPRGGAGDYEHLDPSTAEYRSQPQTEARYKAQREISRRGLVETIHDLQNNEMLTHWRLNEHDELDGTPNATLTAVYQNVLRQIDANYGKVTNRAVKNWLRDTHAQLLEQFQRSLLGPGRAASMTGKVDMVVNEHTARESYVRPLLGHLEKILGKKGMRFIKLMGDELNGLMRDYADKVVTRAEVTAQLQKIMEAARTKEWQTEARKTSVMTEKRARSVVREMAARMAEHQGMDNLGEDWAAEAAKRMTKMMNGLPVTSKTRGEVEIFNDAINQVVRENAEEAGLRGERIPNNVPMEAKLAAILKNQGLYAEFTRTLHDKMYEEYKPERGSPFEAQVEEFFANMANRSWSQGMVDTLVNQKMREWETTFAKLAQEHYGLSDFREENFKEAVRKAMLDRGVDNDGLLDQLVQDAGDAMRYRMEQGRLDFFGSGAGVRDFLKNMQTTLAAKAKEHAMSKSDIPERMADWLAEDFGIPDTPEMPLASALHDVMMRQYSLMLADERKAIVERMVKRATETAPEKAKKAGQQGIEKILELVNLGVFRDEDAYKALQKKMGLPEFSEAIARQAEALGQRVATSENERGKGEAMNDLSMLIASQKGITPYDMFISGLYVNFLSGTSTHAVNTFSNASSLAGYVATAATQDAIQNRGRHIPAILRALFRASTGSAAAEFRETFFTGHRLASSGEKFFPLQNVLEMQNPVFKSNSSWERGARMAERLAKWEHGFYRFIGGKYVGRALNAMDVYFYKLAQEAAFAAKTGITETHEMRSSALIEAENQLRAEGIDWNENRATRRKREIYANQIINEWRLVNQRGEIDERLRVAWLESHHEALQATFRQDPQGLLGHAAKFIEAWTRGTEDSPNPIGKLLIPFTRIAANVTNQMLEWTPYGFIRYGIGHKFGEDFRLRDEDGRVVGRDPKIAIRASLGTLGSIALMGLFGQHADDEDPYFAVYDDGSKDPQLRKQMMDAGWRPKTIKVGHSYFNYTTTPFAMAFSIMGRHFDDYRDGKITSPTDIGLASSAVAMLQSVTHQSFLSGLTDFMSAVDSPNPEKNMSRLMARMASAPILPNLARQIDKWVNPTVQQAEGFTENFIREFPVVRNELMPSLNVFGEQVKRDPGINFLPGMERFLTMQKTDDPVYNVLGEKQITVPGYSKSAKLGDKVMTREQHYTYVQMAGPRVKAAIQAELPQLRAMTKEEAQERVNEIARKIKEQVRNEMRGL